MVNSIKTMNDFLSNDQLKEIYKVKGGYCRGKWKL